MSCKELPNQSVSSLVGKILYNILICRRLFFFLEAAFFKKLHSLSLQ